MPRELQGFFLRGAFQFAVVPTNTFRDNSQMIIDYVSIENFQSIAAPVRLALRPLTLLYGPNSAGKSAIDDAIQMMFDVMFARDFKNSIRKWARRDLTATGKYLPIKLTLEGRVISRDGEFDSYFEQLGAEECAKRRVSEPPFDGYIFGVQIAFEFQRIPADQLRFKNEHPMSEFSIFIDGRQILHFSEDSGDSHGDNGGYQSGLLKVWPIGIFDQLLGVVQGQEFVKVLPDGGIETSATFNGFTNEFQSDFFDSDLNSTFLKRVNSPLQRFVFSQIAPLERVTANRQPAPDCQNLTQSITHSPLALLAKDVETAFTFAVSPTRSIGAGKLYDSPSGRTVAAIPGSTGVDFVNRALSDLFEGNGYQVVFDVERVTIGKLFASSKKLPDDVTSKIKVTRASLVDSHGTELEFEDVGSGISFVLPVLTAMSTQGSFIQQPELHLHPAMQAKLADLFVARLHTKDVRHHGCSVSPRHIIETHSEYLLLRVLRRIRETHTGRHDHSDLAITPNDIAIYYFDPQLGGYTDITEIPVNEFGDFLKPWPKGFFEERGLDLFDE